MKRTAGELTLKPIAQDETDDPVEALVIREDRAYLIGRSSDADWAIPNPMVSRRHASLNYNAETWFLTDHASRHGTSINGVPIKSNEPTLIQRGDIISFGTWRCRCFTGADTPAMTTTYENKIAPGASISAIDQGELRGVAQRGLDALLALTQSLEIATDSAEVAQAVVGAVSDATGCRRVVIAQQSTESEIEILATTTQQPPRVSRTLIDQATRFGLVQIRGEDPKAQYAQSIVDLNIRSAICAPIFVQGTPVAFMMLDTRDTEGVLSNDAAAFCQSVSRLAGLAFERISTKVLVERSRQLQTDLEAARRAQELLSPAKSGDIGNTSYVFECIPGRIVAGDLFDIFPLDQHRTAFFLGDVSGKGVGAAMLMAACQSQLRTQLLSGADLAKAMSSVNADLHHRSEASKFVTLTACMIDAKNGLVHIADAGHGFCIIIDSDGNPIRVDLEPGFPLGIVDSTVYAMQELSLNPGSRVVLFSDGAVEQPNPSGSQFGFDAVMHSLTNTVSAQESVDRLIRDVQEHASGPLADDLTVASVSLS